jgi:putative integral membrane protein (TIGR02587 family)
MAKRGRSTRQDDSIRVSARAYIRAMTGGLIVGLPLLFTQEMWAHGSTLPAEKALVLLAVAFAIVVGYNALAGFRRERSWLQLLVDSVQAMGIAIVTSTLALLVLGRIGPGLAVADIAGIVALETIVVAFGVSLASAQIQGDGDEGDQGSAAADGASSGSVGRLFVAAGAALLFALNVAPTEEIVLLGTEAPPWLLVLAMAATFLFTLGVVFYADFGSGGKRDEGPLDTPLGETAAAYAVSLVVALLLLWTFGRTEVAPQVLAGEVVMLGVVAAFGGAAGRLLLASRSGSEATA